MSENYESIQDLYRLVKLIQEILSGVQLRLTALEQRRSVEPW